MLKKILKSSSTFLAINVLSTLVQLALISVYVSSFSPRDYGIYALLSSFIAFLTIFSSANLIASLQTFFFDFTDSKKQFAYLRSVFSLAVFITILILIVFLIVGSAVFENTFQDDLISFNEYGIIVFCIAAISSINYIYFEFLRNKQALKSYGLLMISQTFINLTLQVIFIRYFQWGVIGAFWGLLFSNLAIFIYIILTQKLLTFDIDKTLVKQSLKYSLYLMPFLFIQWFMSRADRFIIENYIGLSEVGVYALMMNVAMIISILATSLLNGFRPSLFSSFKQEKDAKNKVLMHFVLYASAIFLVSLILFLLVQNIDLLPIDQVYYSIKPIIGLGLALFGIRVMVRFFNEYLVYQKRSKLLSLLTTLGLLVYVVLIAINVEELTISMLLKILIFSNTIVLCVTLFTIFFKLKKQKPLF